MDTESFTYENRIETDTSIAKVKGGADVANRLPPPRQGNIRLAAIVSLKWARAAFVLRRACCVCVQCIVDVICNWADVLQKAQ